VIAGAATVHSIRARQPRGESATPDLVRDPDRLASHLEDAAHFHGGHATELVAPRTESEFASALHSAAAVLPIGAQSSLTGGATPFGERLISTARMNRIESIGTDSVRAQAGVTLAELDEALAREGRYYPPGPTFTGAFIGGTVATNAAGAATFKHGTTRDWVHGLTVVLPSGDVLDIERESVRAHADGYFELELRSGTVRVPVPTYQMPSVPKLSAGYFAAPGMDLIDLFIGSEGTLGIVTAVTLRVLPARPAFCLVLVPFDDRNRALQFARLLREASNLSRHSSGRRGVDVSAVEYLDRRSIELLREDSVDRTTSITLPVSSKAALLVTMELPGDTSAGDAFDQIGRAGQADAPDTPLVRLSGMLGNAGALDSIEIAVPGDTRRAAQLMAAREAVPAAVNQRIGRAKNERDSRIEKVAADVIVPPDRVEALLEFFDAECTRRGLDGAVWGHVSDGNLHPNVLARSFAEVTAGKAAILDLGREAIRLGGAPLAEHGVGRNAVKQQLLRDLYGASGIDEMRAVKRAIDPEWKLAPGVLFPPA
jgi:D-lactate dehydrogenase (cytochrome)